jgi:hypothetical protein
MGVLIAIWLTLSAVAALLLMPALVYVFKPRFVVGMGTTVAGQGDAQNRDRSLT